MQSVRRIVREIDANVSTTTTWTLIPFFTHSHAEISLTLNEMGGGGLGGERKWPSIQCKHLQ